MTVRRPPRLAKLVPPRTAAELRRTRLLALLDESRSRPVIWIEGPPGAGKTTLAGSFVAAHAALGFWYQLDRGDGDPASFFHYLARAVEGPRTLRSPLPALTPEYLGDLDGFSHRFFRGLFARCTDASVVVFDNYQEVASDARVNAVTAAAVDELPPGMNLIFLSRTPPPPQFARHAAGGRILRIGWEALRLTADETVAIAQRNGVADAAHARDLHAQCGGWAGGLRLLLEQFRQSGAVGDPGVQSLDTIFDYFADQVFDRMPPAMQRVLLRTSALPRMTADIARQVSGEDAAGAILEALHRKYLFTDRRIGEPITYQYHALFRAFLQLRAKAAFRVRDHAALNASAGRALERAGMPDEAIDVYLDGGRWSSAARLITQYAPRLLEQGRGHALRTWIDAMPKDAVDDAAGLQYWLGTSLIPVDQQRARAALERSYALYTDADELSGQLLASAGIIETRFLQHANHRLVDPWLPVHERLLGQVRPDMPAEAQLRAFATMLITLLYRQPGNPMLEACAQRVLILLESLDVAAAHRMSAATFLVWYCGYVGDFITMRTLVPIGNALAEEHGLGALHRANWRTWLGYCQHCMLDDAAAQSSLEPALRLGEENGLPSVIFLASYFLGLVHARMGRHADALACLARMEAAADPRSRIQCAILHAMRGWLAVERCQPADALREGARAWDIGAELGSPSYLVHWGTPVLYGLVETGALIEARRRLAMQREAMAATRIRCFEPMLLGIEAILSLREGRQEAARALAVTAFRKAREQDHAGYLRRLSPWIAACAELALAAGEETDYVQWFVLQARADAPSQRALRWPWKWRIVTLGRFELLIGGAPAAFGRKMPKKPLALLYALVAAGEDGATDDALCDLLWPDTEGDSAHRALAIAIHRLRAILGAAGSVLVTNNRVRLDSRQVWVDAWAFAAIVDEARKGDGASSAIELYAGPFLPGHTDAWVLSLRERLRAAFIRLTLQQAQADEAAEQWERAIHLYRRGIGADDLSEPFYRGLMRCCGHLGRHSEAVVAYRNLQQLLSLTLGRKPARETESLYRSLLGHS